MQRITSIPVLYSYICAIFKKWWKQPCNPLLTDAMEKTDSAIRFHIWICPSSEKEHGPIILASKGIVERFTARPVFFREACPLVQ
jgi:hypothetical protein